MIKISSTTRIVVHGILPVRTVDTVEYVPGLTMVLSTHKPTLRGLRNAIRDVYDISATYRENHDDAAAHIILISSLGCTGEVEDWERILVAAKEVGLTLAIADAVTQKKLTME